MRDQGLGDELFFLRFLPQLKARGAWVAYCPDPRLSSILARVKEIDHIMALGEPPEAFDDTFSVGDLPLLLGMDDVSKIPAPLPLPVPPEQIETMRQRLAQLGPPPYVGVTWRAGIKDKRKLLQAGPARGTGRGLKAPHGHRPYPPAPSPGRRGGIFLQTSGKARPRPERPERGPRTDACPASPA